MYDFSPFRLDKTNQCLLRSSPSGEEDRIHLPPKAYSILEYLLEHAGNLVTHAELMEKLWLDTYVQPEVLASHIRDIRATLGDDARTPKFIETVARRGYRFIARIDKSEASAAREFINLPGKRLVGRESAVSKLHECYSAAVAGQRRLVFVTGEPGIGKTALCLGFLHRLRNSDEPPRIAWGQCIEGYGVQEPYFPLLKAINELCRTGGEPTVRVFMAKAPTWIVQFADLVSPAQRSLFETEVRGATSGRMLREILDALEELGVSRPLVLVLDDLQWVDRASIDFISEFARRRHPARILIIGTFRPLEALLNENPVKILKDELLAHRLCSEIGLAGLAESDIAEYLNNLSADSDLRSRLAGLLYQRSEGNPLFMVAALEHSLEKGLLQEENGQLHLGMPMDQLDLDIPQNLRTIIEAQINHLATEERQILEAGSVAGIVFTPAAIGAAAERAPEQIEDACHHLARRNQIIRNAGVRHLRSGTTLQFYEFVHVLYCEVLYEQQSPCRRSTRHQLIGEQLERIYGGHAKEVAAELGLHFECASDWERTVKYLTLAAENSERRYDHREAVALLSRALEISNKIPAENRCDAELQILEKLAMIYVASFDPRCIETYERMSEVALAYGLPEVSAQALLNLATCLSWDDAERCLKIGEKVSQIAATLPDPLAREKLEMSCHFWHVWAGGWNAREAEQARQCFEKIRHLTDPSELAQLLIEYGMIQWASSEYLESYECVSKGLDGLSEALGEQNPYLNIAYQKAQFYLPRALLFSGDWGKALQILDTSIELADKNGDSFPAQMLRLSRSWILFHAMDFQEVVAISEPMTVVNDRFGGTYLVRLSRLLAGSAYVALGDLARASALLLAAREEMNSRAIVLDWCFRLPLQAALSELWLLSGDFSEAKEDATRYLNLALSTEDYTYRALAFEVNTRLALADKDLSAARDFIFRGIHVVQEHHVPLACWRVHATASLVLEMAGENATARHHREAAKAEIQLLANSLSLYRELRNQFLTALPVSTTLEKTAACAE